MKYFFQLVSREDGTRSVPVFSTCEEYALILKNRFDSGSLDIDEFYVLTLLVRVNEPSVAKYYEDGTEYVDKSDLSICTDPLVYVRTFFDFYLPPLEQPSLPVSSDAGVGAGEEPAGDNRNGVNSHG